MDSSDIPIKLVVFGQRSAGQADTGFSLKDLVECETREGGRIDLSVDRSDGGQEHSVKCGGDDVVALTLEDGLEIFTSVARLTEELIPSEQSRGVTEGEFVIPRSIAIPNQRSRGFSEIAVKTLEILDLKGKAIEKITEGVGKTAARVAAKMIEEQIAGNGGLYSIDDIRTRQEAAETQSGSVPETASVASGDVDASKPALVFIHGTASSSSGSFGDLWSAKGAEDWTSLEKAYGKNIFGFEHRTLTQSPIRNALELAEVLPNGATLHLVSHSRGGLVGELLCRGQFSGGRDPFTGEDLDLFRERDSEGTVNAYIAGILKTDGAEPDDYKEHLADLEALGRVLAAKQLKVERFVRVACPARGTTLASGKLDLYLSSILNLIGLIPVLKASVIHDVIKSLVLVFAKERTEPAALPGLEAQMPGSPLVAMLNGNEESLNAPLAVIAGDLEPRGLLKKLGMLLVDRFYESDHDLVVNTPSMDGGGRRMTGIPIMSVRGPDVHHFSYFERNESRGGLVRALVGKGGVPDGFRVRTRKRVEIARSVPVNRGSGDAPVVFMLPGISGSHLKVHNRIWVDPGDLMLGRFSKLKFRDDDGVQPDGLIGKAYGDLVDYLGQTHVVIPFDYDWRASILESSRRLAAAVDAELARTDQPIRIVAHSMGGLVSRGMMAAHPEVWDRFRQRKGSRVLMLGTPNAGSHSIARLFACQDKLIMWLALLDIRHSKYGLLNIMRHFPGILELLPVDDDGRFFGEAIWNEFDEVMKSKWRKPTQAALRNARKTWEILERVRFDPERVFYIAGRADETPDAVDVKDGKIRFTATGRGDGRVPWKGGIPNGVKHWFVDAVHGDLADHRPAFLAIREIIERGDTRLLSTRPPVSRSADQSREMMEDRVDVLPSLEMLETAALGGSTSGRRRRETRLPAIDVSVCHGNLFFTKAPIMVGHYEGDTIVHAEAALDERLGKRLDRRHRLALYPGALKTNVVIFPDPAVSSFPGAIVMGLGEVGELSPGALGETFQAALLQYAIEASERGEAGEDGLRVATLLIGTGAGGLSLNDAIGSMLRAAVQTNRLLAGPTGNADHVIRSLQFIELYEDIAVGAQHVLLGLGNDPELRGKVEIQERVIRGDGCKSRVAYTEDTSWWQRLRIETKGDDMMFSPLTRRAGAPMVTHAAERQAVEPFLREVTADTSADPETGRVLFELLVPREFKDYTRDRRNLVLMLDEESAAYPWEILQFDGGDRNESIALRASMIRQLATAHPMRSDLCMNGKALVIGDPVSSFIELPGAQEEAIRVAELLGERFECGKAVIKPTGRQVLTRLMAGKHQVLHLSGHGVFDDRPPSAPESDPPVTGMVIGDGLFLTPSLIDRMPATPELVFINCCHLGNTAESEAANFPSSPHRLAANLSTQLIRQGVRAVIAAGWAVDDAAALTFASRFYQEMIGGATFGSAVHTARVETEKRHPACNTWAAYQCYGDPAYRFSEDGDGWSGGGWQPVTLEEALGEIRNIGEEAKTADMDAVGGLKEKLQDLETRLDSKWLENGSLQESLGDAWGRLLEHEHAIKAYQAAIKATDGGASQRAEEQLANIQACCAVELARRGGTGGADAIAAATRRLDDLCKRYGSSTERLALLGGCAKRLAHVHSLTGTRPEVRAALKDLADHYKASHQQAKVEEAGVSYPLMNWLTAEWLRVRNTKRALPSGFGDRIQEGREKNPVQDESAEHFWDNVAHTDYRVLAALVAGTLDREREDIAASYQGIRRTAASPRQMSSVIEHHAFLRDVLAALGDEQSAGEMQLLIDGLGG